MGSESLQSEGRGVAGPRLRYSATTPSGLPLAGFDHAVVDLQEKAIALTHLRSLHCPATADAPCRVNHR